MRRERIVGWLVGGMEEERMVSKQGRMVGRTESTVSSERAISIGGSGGHGRSESDEDSLKHRVDELLRRLPKGMI